ncbi:hypothetical protein HYY71_05240 [Candidatus Woesearchaeota archaeon]|nr:hypothetical protein [Candidatus Woesearchaeota archaeon]
MSKQLVTKFNSIREWKDYCHDTHKSYLKNEYFTRWIEEKKIDVFDCSKLEKKEIGMITMAIENALKLCSRSFKIRLNKGLDLDFAISGGCINGAKILNMAKKMRNGSCSASVFLANKRAKSGKKILEFGDALTYVSDGVTIFTFDPNIKYPKRFFKEVIAHEVFHLLGLNMHHYDTKVNGYVKLPKCIMEYNAPAEHLCPKCKDGLLSFWEGMKNAKSN